MKDIINNKMYNTETATKIESWDNGYSHVHPNHITETLYKKKNGEFFLHGVGGSYTQYAEEYGDFSRNGEQIIPYSIEDIKDWLIEHTFIDCYIDFFGDVEE